MEILADVHPWLLENLRCPRHHVPLEMCADELACRDGCVFPVWDDIPVLLLDEAAPTMDLLSASLAGARARESVAEPWRAWQLESLGISTSERQGLRDLIERGACPIDPVVSYLVGATNGISYRGLIGTLTSYPIPELRLSAGAGRVFLDLGCNWGRWCIAAGRKGYFPVGLDPSLGAVLAAHRVARELGVDAAFVVGDARHAPFAAESVDQVFSYSVLQHFSREDAATTVRAIQRVLKPAGTYLIQMPTKFGIRCLYHQCRRGFREGTGFDVRYWTWRELRKLFEPLGPVRFSVDCYFGIGLQKSDVGLMSPAMKAAVRASEALRWVGHGFPPLRWIADSVYVHGARQTTAADR